MRHKVLITLAAIAAVATVPIAASAQQYPQSTLDQVRERAENRKGISPFVILAGVALLALAVYFIARGSDEDPAVSP